MSSSMVLAAALSILRPIPPVTADHATLWAFLGGIEPNHYHDKCPDRRLLLKIHEPLHSGNQLLHIPAHT